VTILEIVALILGLWVILLYIAKKKGESHGFNIAGPLLMWKTEKGKKIINRISKKKIWKHYGDLSIILCIIAMIFTTALILWNVIIAFQIPPQSAPSPRLILGLPGINPVIPIGYGIFALAVAIMIHELFHGILTRFGKLKVKSLGLMFLIVPIGAFVEPDEDELKNTSRIKRSRVFAAGPATNIILAIICLLLLGLVFAPGITPKTEGVIVGNEFHNIEPWGVISELEGYNISSKKEMSDVTTKFDPGSFYSSHLLYNNNVSETKFIFGLYVREVVEDSPAVGMLSRGDIIYQASYNQTITPLYDEDTFFTLMNSTYNGDMIDFSYYSNGSFYNATFSLVNKYDFSKNKEDDGKGFLGIVAYGLNDILRDTDYYPTILDPLSGRFLPYLALPFFGLSPLPEALANIYTPSDSFWVAYNILYWVFWLNFALGTFNALPATPLDGGYIFKDGMSYILSRLGRKKDKAEKISSMLATTLAYIVLFSIIAIIIIPRLRAFI
jgi:membrane-associated protease RseP (regulator of RpoE activity)